MNKQIVIFTLAAITVIVTCYEFDDPLFNEILAAGLKELQSNEGYIHPRDRRDEEAVNADKCKHFKKRKLCCADETFEEIHERDREILRECYKAMTGKDKDPRVEFDPFRCDKVEKHRKEITCAIQCGGQKKNVLDKDGNLKEDEITKYVKEDMSKESWFGPIQDKVISTCLAEAKNATLNRDTSDSESCNPAGVKLMHCLFREIQLGCPPEQIKDQKACARVKDKIKRYNDLLQSPPSSTNDE